MTAALFRVALLVLLAGAARAAQAPEKRVRQIGQEAGQAFSAGDYERALVAYDEVAGLLQQLEGRDVELAYVRYNIARCHDELGHGAAALEAYERVDVDRLPPEYADEVDRRVADLERRLYGTLVVDCGAHPDARVELPDLGLAPQGCAWPWRRLPPGQHRLVATAPDGVRVELSVGVLAGVEGVARVPWLDAVAPAEGGGRALAWGLTGGTVAALIAGGVFNVLARDDVRDGDGALDRQRVAPSPEKYDAAVRDTAAAYDRAEERAVVSYVLFGTGALLGAGALWAWLAGDGPAPEAATGTLGLGWTFP